MLPVSTHVDGGLGVCLFFFIEGSHHTAVVMKLFWSGFSLKSRVGTADLTLRGHTFTRLWTVESDDRTENT